MDQDFEFLKEWLVADIAKMLIQKTGMTTIDALDAIYGSKTYGILSQKSTGLYYQSPKYVFTFLDDELRTGKFSFNEI